MKTQTTKTAKAKKVKVKSTEKSVMMQLFEKQVKIFNSGEVALLEAVFSKTPNILSSSFIHKFGNSSNALSA